MVYLQSSCCGASGRSGGGGGGAGGGGATAAAARLGRKNMGSEQYPYDNDDQYHNDNECQDQFHLQVAIPHLAVNFTGCLLENIGLRNKKKQKFLRLGSF